MLVVFKSACPSVCETSVIGAPSSIAWLLPGLASAMITSTQRNAIVSAHDACKEPPQYTPLGGLLQILGGGGDDDWTAGSIAVADADMDEMWKAIGVGDTIVVVP